tara:strand:- start:724 stop:1890 length:1167 start_codon:yes stop_codon:yes gene_type:complete
MKNKLATVLIIALSGTSFSHTSHADVLDKTSFKFSGFIKVDGILSQYSDGTIASGNISRDFYIPSLTPVGGEEEGAQLDAHVRQSRFRFSTDTKLGNGDTVSGVLEFDFQATPNGDERISNSYTPRVRHAFLKYKNWLVGQTWSTFQDVRTLPESLDFIGATDGTVFTRQALIRYSQGGFDISLENPETTITPFGGGSRIVADDNAVPDLALRYTFKQDWGHIAIAGLVRQLSYENKQGGSDIDTSTTSTGISVTSKINFGQDDLRLMATTGKGLGRYLALNAVNGAVLDANDELQSIDSFAISAAYRHLWDNQWRSTFGYSIFSADNDITLTGGSVAKETYSVRANLLYSPSPELTFGGEYSYAKQTKENDLDGDMSRLQFSAKYAF